MERRSNLGLDGVDPVAYLSTRQPVPGKAELRLKHNGTTYCFRTKANMELFQHNPDRYLPQFDGFCAFNYALFGKEIPAPANISNVLDGQLYFYSKPLYAKVCQMFPGLLGRGHSRYNRIVARVER